MNLAIFPLPLVLFPGGVTKLRIFEQRYLRMVKESAGDTGFVLTTHDTRMNHQTSLVGSWVKVVDFQTLNDGMLGIDIEAQEAVEISNIVVEHDKLCKADITVKPHWQDMPHNDITAQLCEKLQQLMGENQSLSALYPHPNFDSAPWVVARWLEVLPILPKQKLSFFQQDSYTQAVSLLQGIVVNKG